MVIQQYQDPSISRVLKFGFWFQERRVKLAKMLVGALIGVNALFWAYTLYGVFMLAQDARNSASRSAELVAPLSDVAALHQANAPAPLAADSAIVLLSASESNAAIPARVDFLARVRNPNPDWIMGITYTFRWEGGESLPEEWLLLPEAATYLAAVGVPVSELPGDAELVADIAWERVKDLDTLIRPREAAAGISVEDFDVAARNGITDLSATVANASQYTVKGPSLVLVAHGFGGEPVAAWRYAPELIGSGETVTTVRRFLHPISGALGSVVAYLNLDAWSESTYELRGSPVTPL